MLATWREKKSREPHKGTRQTLRARVLTFAEAYEQKQARKSTHMQRYGTSRSLLTLVGAEQVLPASPQQAGESGHAGRDLPLQQRTDSGADLQQVVGADVPAQFHLVTQHRLSSACRQDR